MYDQFFERMVHAMAYTIIHNNPLIDRTLYNPDVIVTYDDDKDRFCVTFIATNTGYFVDRGELVSEDFKYTNRIEEKILSGCETDEELNVVFTTRVHNQIHLIWMANCDIFN